MDSQLEPEIERRIRALCDEIAMAYDVNDNLREELCGHVEDKVLGYLSGEVPVSEDDAFMLAREHFGDRRRLKELLSEVHHEEATGALWRRMAGGFVVMYGIGVAVAALGTAAAYLVEMMTPIVFQNRPWARLMLGIIIMATYSGLVIAVLARQKRRLEGGGTLWLARWPAWSLWAVVSALFLARPAWGMTVGILGVLHASNGVSAPTNDPLAAFALGVALVTVWVVGLSTIWMWWCDSPPRSPKTLRIAASALVVGIFVDSFLQSQFAFTTEPQGPDVYTLLTTEEGHWVWRTLSSGQILGLGVCLLGAVIIALLGWGAYAFALWMGKGRQPQIVER